MTPTEIKELRDKMKLSQEKFAAFVGVTCNTINRWEKGFFKPSPLAIDRMKSLNLGKKDEL